MLTPLRVALLMALLFLIFGWFAKSPCIQQTIGSDGIPVLDSSANRQWISGCYNDIVPAYQIHGLDQSGFPYASHVGSDGAVLSPLDYPVLTGAFMWVIARLTGAYLTFAAHSGVLPQPLQVGAYFTIGAVVLGLLYLWAVASTLKISRRRPWDVAIMCLSPLLVVQAFTNWEILPIALLAAAMLAWAREKPVWAGVLLGLAVSTRFYPILLLIPLFVLCLRAGRLRAFTPVGIATVLTWSAVNLPVALLYPVAWRQYFVTAINRKAEFTTLYAIFSDWSNNKRFNPDLAAGQSPVLLNVTSVTLFGLACVGIGWLGLSAARRPRLAQLMFLTVASFLLVGKVWSPQFSLWLLPLAVLALPRWRPVLVWQLAESALWFLLMLTFATKGDNPAHYALLPQYPYQVMALIRSALLIMLMAIIVWEILRPGADLVRQTGDDDPAGGVLDSAPDVLTVTSLPELVGFRRRSRLERAVEAEWAAAQPAGPELLDAGLTNSALKNPPDPKD